MTPESPIVRDVTSSDDDTVLLALSHPGRRVLLDALHERDGQSVTDHGQALNRLKSTSERRPEAMATAAPLHRQAIVIDATPERVWTALTQECSSWFFTTTLNSSLEPGSDCTYTYPDGRLAAEGTIIAADPGQRLEMTFSPTWDDAVTPEAPFRLVWSLAAQSGATLLTVEHYELDPSTETARQVGPGSLFLISNIQTWIETGQPMHD